MKRQNFLRNITNKSESKKIKPEKTAVKEEEEAFKKEEETPLILMYSEYREQSIQHLKKLEAITMPDPNYMEHQEELQWPMRAILVDWLIEVHLALGLVQETLFFTVNIIDRFLSARTVSSDKLQLVGVTALFISSKYEEVECPSIETFCLISKDALTEEDVRKAEKYILYVLQCFLSFPSPLTFLHVCNRTDSGDKSVFYAAQYILERMCIEQSFLKYPGSIKACCAVYLAKKVCNKKKMIESVPLFVGYTLEDLRLCLEELKEVLSLPSTHKNVFSKYKNLAYKNASVKVNSFFEGKKIK